MKKVAMLVGVLALGALGLAASGEQVYAQCAGCHQATGQGVPGAFPPLAKELPRIVATGDAGRQFLIQVVLFGLQGPIVAQGKTYNGAMPPYGHLSDADVAAVLNYTLTAWGNAEHLPKDFKPYTAEEVAKERGLKLTPQQVYQEWKALVEAKE